MKKNESFLTGLKISVFHFYNETHDDVYMSSGLGKD